MAGLTEKVRDWFEAQLGEADRSRIRSLLFGADHAQYDAFGCRYDTLLWPVALTHFLYRRYFRCITQGTEHVPAGRAMLVANHSGQLPFDALNIAGSMMFDAVPPRLVRGLIDRFVPAIPYIGYWFARWGQVVGTPNNCRRLLEDEELVLVFPEGTRGIAKSFWQRYQLQSFGHGFIRLAATTRTPIVPVAVIGAEEQAPAANLSSLARRLRLPALPITPLPPFLPLVPLPVRYYLYFGEPIVLDEAAATDSMTLESAAVDVKRRIESLLHAGLRRRRSLFK